MIICLEKMNPTVKMIMVLVCAVILGFNRSVAVNLTVTGICLFCILFLTKRSRRNFPRVLLPILFLVLVMFMTGYRNGAGAGSDAGYYMFTAGKTASNNPVYIGLKMSSRVLAYASLGMFFTFTTDNLDFIQSLMQQGHMKPKFAYGILAAFHLIPQIGQELSDARLAFRVRGIRQSPISLKPFFAAMVNCMRWSETLAMAMESKGFDGDGQRTSVRIMKVRRADVILCISFILFVLLACIDSHFQFIPLL